MTEKTLKAGVAIDDHKLPVFERHLTEAGYTFKQEPGLLPRTLMLVVEITSIEKLEAVLSAANAEVRRGGRLQ